MNEKTDIALIKKDIKYIISAIDDLKKNIDDMKNCYVTKESFMPVRNGFFATIGTICLTVLGALLAVVVRANQ